MERKRAMETRSTIWWLGAVGCLLVYAYALWAALASYKYRHFDPQWEFAQNQGFLIGYDILYTFAPIVVVAAALALFAWRRRHAVLGAVIANTLIATNAVVPVIKERQILEARGMPAEAQIPLLPAVVVVLAVASLAFLGFGSREGGTTTVSDRPTSRE